jgi:hypothetical protein
VLVFLASSDEGGGGVSGEDTSIFSQFNLETAKFFSTYQSHMRVKSEEEGRLVLSECQK